MTKLLGAVSLLMLVVMLVALGGIAVYLSAGGYDVGAGTPHWEITGKVMRAVRDRSIAVRAKQIEVPNLADEQLVLKGAGQYAAMCADCHLTPEQPDSEIRVGLYPKPPNLTEQRVDARRAFWVIKHGLKMTGMPAWGLTHDDAVLWSVVAFLNKLPGLSAEHYKDLVARAPPDEKTDSMTKGDGQKPARDEKASPTTHEEKTGGHKH